jgi:transposase
MDDAAYYQYFAQPTQTYQRQYEALRAIFYDGRSQKDVAEEFGFQYSTMRQLAYEFRKDCDAGPETNESPFFETPR